MRRSTTKDSLEIFTSTASPVHADGRSVRGAPPALITHLPAPFSAALSPQGILSWEWHRWRSQWSPGAYTHTNRKVISRLFLDFAELADASDEKIRRFAARWGPLRYRRPGGAQETETIDQWRNFARLAYALVRSASLLARKETAVTEDWRLISNWAGSPTAKNPGRHHGRILLAQALNTWYDQSSGNSIVTIHRDKIILQPQSTSLFGILGLQLARLITGSEPSLVCYHCRRFYVPHNKPRTGSRTFCKACRRTRKPDLYAMRDYRARRKQSS